MELNEWLPTELGQTIWKTKYQQNDETFDGWLDRVSANDETVRQLIIKKKFLFGGRILSNRGLKNNSTLSNCYVCTPPDDSIESIYDTCKKMARTFSFGG